MASEWVDRYERDAELAMLELVQFLIRCCGCKARITEEMFKSDTTADAIMELTKKFSESSYEYPLTMTGPQQKKFEVQRVCAHVFVHVFVQVQCKCAYTHNYTWFECVVNQFRMTLYKRDCVSNYCDLHATCMHSGVGRGGGAPGAIFLGILVEIACLSRAVFSFPN